MDIPTHHKKRYLALVILIIGAFFVSWNTPAMSTAKRKHPIPKSILLWNSFFEDPGYGFGLTEDAFMKNQCEFTNCFVTNNKSLMPLAEYDAVVFHAPRLQTRPNFTRAPHQRYVFLSLESPPNSRHAKSSDYEDFYNWTISYRHDSDIYFPYGQVVPGENKVDILNFVNKTKSVAWFVSNCNSGSSREKYVKKLSEFIPVDIYGACGNLTCKKPKDCNQMLENDYKFYLSFENTVCDDYVTEKLFKILKHNIVPVVLGGADYDKSAPRNSVINAMNYAPEDLAKILYEIGSNETEYRTYLEWKRESKVRTQFDPKDTSSHAFCKLCEKLHLDKTPKVYGQFRSWWNDGKCRPGPIV